MTDHNKFPSEEGSGSPVISAKGSGDSPSDTILDWNAHITCQQHEIGDSFSVIVFLSKVPPDSEWLTGPAYAGTFDVMQDGCYIPDECSNCCNHTILGVVPLNYTILKRSGLHSLEPDVVMLYLKHNLNWGINKVYFYLIASETFSYCGTRQMAR